MGKLKRTQIFRFITQLIFFILLPGLFTLAFGELKALYINIINLNFTPIDIITKYYILLILILMNIIFGRFFCGWFCSFGYLNDLLYTLGKKVFKVNFKVKPKTHKALNYVKYLVLIFIFIASWNLSLIIVTDLNPWDAFGMLTSFDLSSITFTYGLILLGLIFIACIFIERFFCKYLCPLGGIFALSSRFRVINIFKKKDKCGKCQACSKACAMDIELYKMDKVRDGECINCFKCVDICPRSNAMVTMGDEKISSELGATCAVAAFVLSYSGGNIAMDVLNLHNANMQSNVSSSIDSNSTTDNSSSSNNSSSNSSSSSNSGSNNNSSSSSSGSSSNSTATKYKDGTYTGTANAYRPGLTVQVTIKNGNIANVEVTKINDTPGYYNACIQTIPSAIVKAQSTKVNGIAGATRTSNGIKKAVENALSQALN